MVTEIAEHLNLQLSADKEQQKKGMISMDLDMVFYLHMAYNKSSIKIVAIM